MHIPFTKPFLNQVDVDHTLQALSSANIGGNGEIGRRAEQWLRSYLSVDNVLLTTSCSHALELAMMALDIGPGDEVILPSFSFVTAATAVIRQGARPVFAEIDESTFNLDPADVTRRITPRTRAIIAVHYAGQGCQMDALLALAKERNLYLVEDAAQAIGATYGGRPLGTFGHAGCFSFHSTKNIVCGEGGAFVTNDPAIARRAEIIREKGTNRSQFLRGEVDKYTWVDIGSSFVISDLLAALLLSQLQRLDEITRVRRSIWWRYYHRMADLEYAGLIVRPGLDPQAEHNGHIYAFRVVGTEDLRNAVLNFFKQYGIGATFHFIPLHSSPYGQKKMGYRSGDLPITEQVSRTLIRLPLYPELSEKDIDFILEVLHDAFHHLG